MWDPHIILPLLPFFLPSLSLISLSLSPAFLLAGAVAWTAMGSGGGGGRERQRWRWEWWRRSEAAVVVGASEEINGLLRDVDLAVGGDEASRPTAIGTAAATAPHRLVPTTAAAPSCCPRRHASQPPSPPPCPDRGRRSRPHRQEEQRMRQ